MQDLLFILVHTKYLPTILKKSVFRKKVRKEKSNKKAEKTQKKEKQQEYSIHLKRKTYILVYMLNAYIIFRLKKMNVLQCKLCKLHFFVILLNVHDNRK